MKILLAWVLFVCLGQGIYGSDGDVFSTYEDSSKLNRLKRSLFKKGTKLWPNGVVPYEFSDDFSSQERSNIVVAMGDWQAATCIEFRPAVSNESRIRIVKHPNHCSTKVGWRQKPVQTVYIGERCNKRNRLQVLGALLGLRYEILRPDRGRYIKIDWKNIRPGYSNQFRKYKTNKVDTLLTKYDMQSIMHFKDGVNSKNGHRTIELTSKYLNVRGKVGGSVISFGDAKGISLLYKCIDKNKCAPRRCRGSGFVGRDCKCWCRAKPIAYCISKYHIPGIRIATTHAPKKSCFPGDVHLLLDTGHVIQMKDLRAGQRVLTVKFGQRVFSEVKTFMKRHPNDNSTYITLSTDQGSHVSLSGDHLIFTSTNKSAMMEAKLAGLVKPGDYIFSTTNCARGVCAERVVQVSLSYKQGIYVPLTDEGTVVVNGILASCYTTVAHDVAHLFMTPFRWFPWLLASHQQDGYSPLIPALKAFGRLIVPKHVLLEEENRNILQSLYHPRLEL